MPTAPDPTPSRRAFMKGAAVGGGLLPLLGPSLGELSAHAEPGPAQAASVPLVDFTDHSAALQPDQVLDGACQFCNSLCRLKIHVKNGRVLAIRGEPEDP